MLTTFKATATKLPEGLQVESESRGFKILMDEPEDFGGTNKAMNPVESILCTLGSCQTILAASMAKMKGFDLQGFTVELEGDLDPDGFMGNTDIRPGYQQIRCTMHLKTSEPQDKVERFCAMVEKFCPVGDCLANPVELVFNDPVVE